MRSQIPHRGDFGIADDDGRIGISHRQCRAALDSGRAVADDPVETLAQLGDHAADAFFRQRVLVARLRGRQQVKVLEPLVANERLRQLGHALHDVDQVEDDTALGTHHQVKVAQADVEVDDRDFLVHLRQRCAQRCRRGRLANATLARRYHDHLSHF